MKEQIREAITHVRGDRYFLLLLLGFVTGCLLALIYLAVVIRPSELQVVVHYTSFGSTNFYRDRWYYLLTFASFIMLLVVAHSSIAIRLLVEKGRQFALPFIWLGIVVLVIALALFYQILKVASLS